MDNLNCDLCDTHLGWMTYAGPRGGVYCDSCKEKRDEEEEEWSKTQEEEEE